MRSICRSYGMETLSLETESEALSFLDLCHRNKDVFDVHTLIGGITTEEKSLDKWYWLSSGRRIDYSIPFGPGEPNFAGKVEFCLGVTKYTTNDFKFNDVDCSGTSQRKFICQRNVKTVNAQDETEIF